MKPAHALLGLVLLFVGALAGGWIGSSAVSNPPAPAKTAAEDTSGVLRELLEEVRGLRSDLRAERVVERAPEPPRVAATSESSAGTSLERELAELVELLRTRPGLAAKESGFPAHSREAAGFASREALAVADGNLSKPHAFWTMREVVERYGEPDFCGSEEGFFTLWYRRGAPEPRSPSANAIVFKFLDGLLVDVSRR